MRLPWTNDNTSKESQVPLREKGDGDAPSTPSSQIDDVALSLHPIPSKEALLVKIQPPTSPSASTAHVPCDIVLVIDVSGSMGVAAPVPGEDDSESTGLSVLDLVKHAAMTIIETMDESDRLGIVTFGSKSKVVQTLTPMTDASKAKARQNVKKMATRDATNLWHGLQDGLKLFDGADARTATAVPAVMVLTDGMPNHMCPKQGYVPKMRTMLPFPATIHTFGFGYGIRSGLLKSIAEIGGGNYAFIPDAGMIGTVFVHAVANLQATYATQAVLQLKYSVPLEVEQMMGDSVDKVAPVKVLIPEFDGSKLEIQLGNLQYGQSRDIFLRVKNVPGFDLGFKDGIDTVGASLSLKKTAASAAKTAGILGLTTTTRGTPVSTAAQCNIREASQLTDAEIAYHESRARICAFLSSLFPIGPDGEHRTVEGDLESQKTELADLIATLPAKDYTDALNQSLIQDLTGAEPQGQVSLAVNNSTFFRKWGIHYLPSLLNAHTRQICNSFKDPGPLCYGTKSPLFTACRDRLDTAFDSLPPPEPTHGTEFSRFSVGYGSHSHSTAISMSRYNTSAGPCFAGSTAVELASGRKVAIRKLRRGIKIRTPVGVRKVAMVLKTPVQAQTMCRVGELLVTPWHPVSLDDNKSWVFPAEVAEKAVRYTGAVYSVLLQQDPDSGAHAIRVGGVWGVTLGHGIVFGSDMRAHEFLGSYQAVGKSLLRLGFVRDGLVVGGGVERDETTGLVCGFKRLADRTVATGRV